MRKEAETNTLPKSNTIETSEAEFRIEDVLDPEPTAVAYYRCTYAGEKGSGPFNHLFTRNQPINGCFPQFPLSEPCIEHPFGQTVLYEVRYRNPHAQVATIIPLPNPKAS